MKLVIVNMTVTTTIDVALVIQDEQDLKQQLIAREEAFRSEQFVTKPRRDKSGKLITHQLSKDWPPYP